jgi:hypothetical protein
MHYFAAEPERPLLPRRARSAPAPASSDFADESALSASQSLRLDIGAAKRLRFLAMTEVLKRRYARILRAW